MINRSAKLPGLIIQSYLVLVELFELDPMEPLHRVKVEEIEEIEARDSFSIVFNDTVTTDAKSPYDSD